MKVIIAGGRDFNNLGALYEAINDSGFAITEVVSGACLKKRGESGYARGADGLGEKWANEKGIPVRRFFAEDFGAWPACGPKRNEAMAQYVGSEGGLIALPGGRGTASMLSMARKHKLHVYRLAIAVR